MVYFIQGEITRLIKIGWTTRSEAKYRVLDMQTGSPDRLTVLKVVGGSAVYEASLHKKFSHLNVHGEWFQPAEDLLKFIDLQMEGSGTQTHLEWLQETLAKKLEVRDRRYYKLIKLIREQKEIQGIIAYEQPRRVKEVKPTSKTLEVPEREFRNKEEQLAFIKARLSR